LLALIFSELKDYHKDIYENQVRLDSLDEEFREIKKQAKPAFIVGIENCKPCLSASKAVEGAVPISK